MSRKQSVVRLVALVGSIGLLLTSSTRIHRPRLSVRAETFSPESLDVKWPSRVARRIEATPSQFSLPVVFEPNPGQAGAGVQYLGRGKGFAVLLSRREIAVSMPRGRASAANTNELVRIRFMRVAKKSAIGVGGPGLINPRVRDAEFAWRGSEKLRGNSNYFIGSDRGKWRTHVPLFAQVQAEDALPGVNVSVYGGSEGVEYDLRLAPGGANPSEMRLGLSGADNVRIAENGDLVLRVGAGEMRMKRPDIYQESILGKPSSAPGHGTKLRETARSIRRRVSGGYVIEADGSVGFRLGPYDSHATLVIDPSISVTYETFIGGSGNDAARSVALDSSGNIYIAGTTTMPGAFPEAGSKAIGPGIGTAGSAAEFFIAKIDPRASGANSLIYLTFLGGSANQAGGLLAVDASGDAAIAGTTSSSDFPVTDGSARTTGSNDATVSEIDPTGGSLLFSTIFGGNGTESQYNTGGIALDSAGKIYIASDTTSSNLPATSGAFETALAGGTADGFLAIFQPSKAPSLAYCSYLGTNSGAQVGVGGIAVDAPGNVYIAGFSSNAGSSFPAKNAFQSAYGGDPTDAFLMKVFPGGQGASDVIYATLMGGSGEDEALAVAVDNSNPPIAYVTGTTQSADFPTNGAPAAFQPNLHPNATANAFLAAVVQNPVTGMTSLAYSTYFGGSAADAGRGVAVAALNAVYVAGTTISWDFPWHDNLQPFNGNGDAFVAKFDPTGAGASSLIYATPLGGTAPPGASVNASASAIAADRSGNLYVAGQTTASDFPTATSTAGVMNGFQSVCESCQASPALGDSFLVGLQESASQKPSVYFNIGSVVFPPQVVGTPNAPQLVALHNGGEATLNIATLAIAGPNSADFSLIGGAACQGQAIPPAGECSFEVNFVPSIAGPEAAVVSFTDDAPGSPQLLELEGQGQGPFASLSATSLNFGSQPVNTTSAGQTITVTNTGNQTLTMSSPTETGTGSAQFSLSGADTTCGASLAPGQGCTIGVLFEPKAIGSFSAEVDIGDDSGGVSNAVQVVTLAGTGTAAAPVVSVVPVSLAFGSIDAGSASGAQPVTLSNSGSAPLNVTSIGTAGTNVADFKLSASGSSACPLGGGSVAAGASCTMSVQFSPKAGDSSGNKTASLNIADNASGSPQTVALSGTTISPPTIQISPGSLNFPAQSAGTASPGQTIAVLNTSGASSLSIGGISVVGANAADFTETNDCPPILGAGASCTVNVTFNPESGAVAIRSATIDVADNAPGSPQAIPLSGTATLAGISLSSANLNFGGQQAGTVSPPEAITVTNDGTGALSFSSIAITGADFRAGANTCSAANTPPGGSCTIQLMFSPACTNGPAARSATLVLNDNAPGSPQNISLGGTATGDFCFDPPAPGVTSATVAPGQTAAYTLVVNSPTGYKGSVSLACSGAPAKSTCTVPASITVPSQFTVSVPTTANSTASLATKRPPIGPLRARGLFLAAAFALLAWVAARSIGARCRTRVGGACAVGFVRCARMAVLLSAFAFGIAACSSAGGGGGGNVSGTPGTPAGTYVLTVTGSTASSNAKVALTLTVN